MENPLMIEHINIYTEDDIIEDGTVIIENGRIKKIEKNAKVNQMTSAMEVIDGTGYQLIPGFIDTHIHGANGADVMDATKDAIDTIASILPVEGTTSFLATTVTQSNEAIEKTLSNLALYESKPGNAEILGIHLEGPFINHKKKGAQNETYIRPPNYALFNKWQEISHGKIKTITLAPEREGMSDFITNIINEGIVVSAGHTDTNFEEMKEAVNLGVQQLTHICNAMNGIHHRDIGAVGAAFYLENLKAELIVDFIHVAPEMVELLYHLLGSKRLMLVTDAIRAKYLPSGIYDLGGQEVLVNQERAVLKDHTIAGSVLRMDVAVKNMLSLPGVSIRDIIQMASVNPAKQIGVFDRKGSIAINKDADLLIVDDNLNIKFTLCKGIFAYMGAENEGLNI